MYSIAPKKINGEGEKISKAFSLSGMLALP